jgi:hypothetical protein
VLWLLVKEAVTNSRGLLHTSFCVCRGTLVLMVDLARFRESNWLLYHRHSINRFDRLEFTGLRSLGVRTATYDGSGRGLAFLDSSTRKCLSPQWYLNIT